jgi:hypothetical protein
MTSFVDEEFYGYDAEKCADLSDRIMDTNKCHVMRLIDDNVLYSTLFGINELVGEHEFKTVLYSAPIMPLKCLCGCDNNFSVEDQKVCFTKYNKFRLFCRPSHLRNFKKNHFRRINKKNE